MIATAQAISPCNPYNVNAMTVGSGNIECNYSVIKEKRFFAYFKGLKSFSSYERVLIGKTSVCYNDTL